MGAVKDIKVYDASKMHKNIKKFKNNSQKVL